jgi:outer membrane protein OmpA-like peptidoglycan-associated protein
MRHCLTILFLLLFFIPAGSVYAQSNHTRSNKALKAYNEGVTAFDYFELAKAEADFKEAISIDKGFYEAYISLGELLEKQKRFSEAVQNFRSAIRLDSLYYKPVFFSLGMSELKSGEYASALVHLNVYLAQTGMQEKNRIIAQKNVKNCEFALKAIRNPVPFNPINIGSAINTTDDEYWPSLTADGQTLMFTRQPVNRAVSSAKEIPQEDFYISFLVDDVWQKAVNAGTPLNTRQNEGAQTLSSNGRYMYFTACDRPGGMGSCDIYFSAFNDGRWSEPFNLGPPVNSSHWESQPSISADGKTLFFSSNRPGGFGGKDLWYSTLNDKNLWSNPVNLGNKVNTEGDEMSPFIHFDGKTLYFSSDGLKGLGGFDIFITRLNSDSTWSEPQNLGYPINTYNDETGLVIESGGQIAFYSSVRDKTNGKDIFYFDLYESVRPEPVSYLKGKVYDKETGQLIKAEYELINLSSNKVTMKSSTDAKGNFLVCLPSGYNYGINVSKQGYLFYSENFMFEGEHTAIEPLIKKIYLSPIKTGESMLLANVFYEVDSWELKKESVSELNTLADLLTENKGLHMEIGGYTDSTGSAEYNQNLSEKRALSVVNYLIAKGISSDRLKPKGYGNTSPIGSNVTEEGRRLNRRTEAKIIQDTK